MSNWKNTERKKLDIEFPHIFTLWDGGVFWAVIEQITSHPDTGKVFELKTRDGRRSVHGEEIKSMEMAVIGGKF